MVHVLSVAYPFAPVHPDAIGGAEQVVSALDAALVSAGQHSTLLARTGSRAAGRLVTVEVGDELSTRALQAARRRYLAALRALLAAERFDLVHFHGCDCGLYLGADLSPGAPPQLVTLHVPWEWYDAALFRPELGPAFTCVSAWQRDQLAARLPLRATIENGVDLARWRPLPERPHGYVLCLGRISPEKGFDRALRAAHRAGVPLVLAGQLFPYPDHQRYFAEQIVPLLDDRRRFVGAVGGEQKRLLLARARALVVASRVPETSSLAAMEALACGVPVVVASPGAPASLIEENVTGLIARDDDELARSFDRIEALDRGACRESAERRFDLRVMTRSYLELYRALAAAPRARPSAPALLELAT